MNGYNVKFLLYLLITDIFSPKIPFSEKKTPVGIDIMQTKQYITTVFSEVTIVYEMIAGC